MALKFRRGTTAQQSGSLAFGEPYVNTTLGTLLVGGASGDIQLANSGPSATFTGASVSASSFVSASNLKVTGNASVDGDLTLGGKLTIGDATSDTINVVASLSSSLIPQTTNAFDLGSADKIWRDLYVSTGSIKFVEGNTVVKTLSPSTLTALESKTGSYASTGSNSFQNTQYITGGIEVYAASNPDIRIANGTTGVGYHIQNGDGGNLQIHNSTNDKLLFLFHSASITDNHNASFYGGLTVSQSLLASRIDATRMFASQISASVITSSIAATNGVVSGSSQVVGILGSLNTYTSSLNNAIQLTGSTVSFLGDIVVYGTQSIINSTNLAVADNLIYLNNESTITNPDLGIVGNYNDGTYKHAGIFRDASDSGAWKVFEGYTIEPSGTIDTTGNGFALADFKADVITATSFNGTINSTNGVVSGSSQIDHNSTTNYVANRHIDHTSVLISAGNGLSGGGDISSTRTLTLDSGSAHFTDGVKTALNSNTVVSGSSQITYASISSIPAGIVSGAAQIPSLLPGGTVSGSSQVVGSSITTNTVTFNGTAVALGGSGTITAANPNALTIGTGLSGTSYTGASAVTIANTGVLSITTNTGLSTNASATGNVTITNTGVTSNVAGTGISVSGATGAVTITNSGVTSITGTANQVVASASTGGVTLSLPQSIATTSTPTFGNLTINGTITATGDITAFFTSDIRHKNNVTLIDNALEKVNALNGVTWEWNDDVDEVTKQTPKTGLIAQDVLDVLPEVVKTRENGFLALDYSKMVGLLVEAIKEQDIVIQKLKTDMVQLNNTITVFEERMKEKGLL